MDEHHLVVLLFVEHCVEAFAFLDGHTSDGSHFHQLAVLLKL
jgi:hypothetical protein